MCARIHILTGPIAGSKARCPATCSKSTFYDVKLRQDMGATPESARIAGTRPRDLNETRLPGDAPSLQHSARPMSGCRPPALGGLDLPLKPFFWRVMGVSPAAGTWGTAYHR